MAWQFQIHYVPGSSIPAPDATSRSPDDRNNKELLDDIDWPDASIALAAIQIIDEGDYMESSIVAAARASFPKLRAVTWERVRDETSCDIHLLQLIDMAEHGFPASPQLVSPQILPYWRFRNDLWVVDGVLMYGFRAIIPPKLRQEVIANLHSAHQGITQMNNRASQCVFWPGITTDIESSRVSCETCDVNAPSQPKMPPADPFIPTAPFQAVASDYFHLEGKSYLLTVYRFSNWPDLREAQAHSSQSGAHGLIKANRELFATFGVPEELSSDGGPEYIAKDFEDFLKTWGIKHRQSSAYNSQSNGRAEVTVKAMKRLLRDNIDHHGKLNTDAVTRAMLQLRNTPETDSGLSPAQVLLGRTLRDSLPLMPPIPRGQTVFDPKSAIRNEWKSVWSAKEHALKQRLAKQVEKLQVGAHELQPLLVGDTVRIQNQRGSHPNKWDKTGTVMQVGDNDQYIVRVDGSRRLTLRNRRFLRKMQPISPDAYYLHRQAPPHTKSSTQIPHSLKEIVPQLPLTQSPMKQLESPNLVRAISPPKQKDTPALLPALPQTEAQRHDPAFDLPSYAPEIHDQGQEVQSPLSPLKQQVRPAPGRPRKKVAFNFSQKPTAELGPSLQPPTQQSNQSSPQRLVPSSPEVLPAVQLPVLRRSTRERQEPDWYKG